MRLVSLRWRVSKLAMVAGNGNGGSMELVSLW